MIRALHAELSKLVSLPATWAACGIGILLPAIVEWLHARTTLGTIARGTASTVDADIGFLGLHFGVIGAIILGVVAIGSEYATEGEESAGSRQIHTSLTAMPARVRLLAAKTIVVGVGAAVIAAAACAATFAVLTVTLGDHMPALDTEMALRIAGVGIYWLLTAWIAFSLTVFTRHGIVPMAALIANNTVTPVSFLLARATSLANYLPDAAGLRMFRQEIGPPSDLTPLTGGLVIGAWVLTLLGTAAIAFHRRDA